MNMVMRLTITEVLVLARLLRNNVLAKEGDEADWHNLSFAMFESD